MKEEFKNIILMGLGAMSLTTDKAKELRGQLLEEGKKLYEEGKVKNEELKHNVMQKMKENVTVVVEKKETSKEDFIEAFKEMSKEDQEELIELFQQENMRKGEAHE